MGEMLIHSVLNQRLGITGRRFPGLSAPMVGQSAQIAARAARMFVLKAGDLIAARGLSAEHDVRVLAFDAKGRDGLAALGLEPDAPANWETFDYAALDGWVGALGGEAASRAASTQLPFGQDPLVVTARADVTAWVVSCVAKGALTDGSAPGEITVNVTRSASDAPLLPAPMGAVRDEFTIRRGTAQAYELAPGESVQIIDVDGQQCSDFMAFCARGLDAEKTTMIDSTATRSMVRRSFPGPGLFDKFYDYQMRPLLNVMQDTCGRHDTFGLACTARGYEERGFPGHVNCSDNISGAMAPFGVAPRNAWPAINFFWNTWVDPQSHQIHSDESWS